MSKKLVAYFFLIGVTVGVAQNLTKAADADLCDIKHEVS